MAGCPQAPHRCSSALIAARALLYLFVCLALCGLLSCHHCRCRTAVTEDGKRSAQFEHTLLITKDGCEVLTQRLPTSPPLWWEE
jgi:hypothetical protein